MITIDTDVLVVGAGLAGLIAAAKAAEQGKKVTLAAKGWGALGLSSGCIDLWGYDLAEPAVVTAQPLNEIKKLARLNPGHPYNKTQAIIKESLDFLQEICLEHGNPYLSNQKGNWLLPTALGTLRPTFLAPRSMAIGDLSRLRKILVVGFRELKDFYPEVLTANLWRTQGLHADCQLKTAWVRLMEGELNPGTLAWQLEQPSSLNKVCEQVEPLVEPGMTVFMPPVLGAYRNSQVAAELAQRLGCQVYEVTNIPPAMPGQRLQQTLLQHLKSLGVEMLQGCTVTGAETSNKQCVSVKAQTLNRSLIVLANSVVLASGSFFGGGLVATPAKVKEKIFDFPVKAIENDWSDPNFFNLEGQAFNKFGLRVDEALRPLDAQGGVSLENVYAAGAILAGADFAIEKCGNGVALATGYMAGKLAGEAANG